MNSASGGQLLAYLLVAIVVIVLAFGGIAWAGRKFRGELGSKSAPPRGGPVGPDAPEQIPPAMVKEAIARGLVVPAQLAGMTPEERTFFFASLKEKLAPTAPPALPSIFNAERLRAWCPMCGTELQLPTFPPLLARCASCGMQSAIRAEEGGRYVVIVSPSPKLS
jgi:hypothetical protein